MNVRIRGVSRKAYDMTIKIQKNRKWWRGKWVLFERNSSSFEQKPSLISLLHHGMMGQFSFPVSCSEVSFITLQRCTNCAALYWNLNKSHFMCAHMKHVLNFDVFFINKAWTVYSFERKKRRFSHGGDVIVVFVKIVSKTGHTVNDDELKQWY